MHFTGFMLFQWLNVVWILAPKKVVKLPAEEQLILWDIDIGKDVKPIVLKTFLSPQNSKWTQGCIYIVCQAAFSEIKVKRVKIIKTQKRRQNTCFLLSVLGNVFKSWKCKSLNHNMTVLTESANVWISKCLSGISKRQAGKNRQRSESAKVQSINNTRRSRQSGI